MRFVSIPMLSKIHPPPAASTGTRGPRYRACRRCYRSLRGLASRPRPTQASTLLCCAYRIVGMAWCILRDRRMPAGNHLPCTVQAHCSTALLLHCTAHMLHSACRPGGALDHFRQQRARAAAQGGHPALLHPLPAAVARSARSGQDHCPHRVRCCVCHLFWSAIWDSLCHSTP